MHAGLRDRALIALMVYSFARIGAALGMTVEDVYTQNRCLWVRLREKGGKRHAMPCHHNLEEYLTAYLSTVQACAMIPRGRSSAQSGGARNNLTRRVLPQANAYAMIGRRAAAAGIATKLGNFARPGSRPISRTAARSKGRGDGETMHPKSYHATLRSAARRGQPR
jgi:integrase